MPNTASKLRVLIATTNGPVDVLLLTEEDAAIGRCVACIGGTTETADIAAAYHAFVVRPTGVIESRFGHSCYRLDVSGRIDAGSSWQLGVLAAHGLLAAGRLAQENDTADAVLWATGSVRPVDLTVGAVSHVPEKIANSLDRLKRERDAGRRVLLALPSANAAEMPPKLASELAALGIETVALAHVEALFGALATKLPEAPHKAFVPTPARTAAAPAPPRAATASRQRLAWGATVAVALVGIMAGAAVLLERNGESAVPLQPKSGPAEPSSVPEPVLQTASRSIPPPAPQSAPAPKSASVLQAAPQSVELVAELVPFISAHDRLRIRDEYMTAPDYKALATSLMMTSFVSGHPSQESADKAAMEACEKVNGPPRTTGPQMQRVCDLYASGNAVVTRRNRPPMPPTPWVVHNATAERPFAAADIPMVPPVSRERAAKNYQAYPRSKTYVISTTGTPYLTYGQSSPEDVVRRTLERCGYESSEPCMVVAVDDTFVIPVPTLAKAVGFYRPDSLTAVSPRLRDEIARRLANATDGWNAVAVGAGGQVGIKVGAGSEQSAVDGATEDCANRDRDCRVVVIGPFLVDAARESKGQGRRETRGPDLGQP
jgi:hypothetical protein